MAHLSLEPADQDRYFAGDSLRILFGFKDKHNDQPIDITNSTIEFLVKDSLTDTDADALLTKSSDATDESGNPEIEITDATNGECEVVIATGDTDPFVEDGELRLDSTVVEWVARVTDADGNRVTAETGDWEVWSS